LLGIAALVLGHVPHETKEPKVCALTEEADVWEVQTAFRQDELVSVVNAYESLEHFIRLVARVCLIDLIWVDKGRIVVLRFKINDVFSFNLIKFCHTRGSCNWLNKCICVFQFSHSSLANQRITKLIEIPKASLNIIDLCLVNIAHTVRKRLDFKPHVLASAFFFRPELSQRCWTIRVATTVIITASRGNIASAGSK